MSILSGVKVLDFSHYIAGPFCSQILGDHGADVIKVEQINGERGRIAPPLHDNGESLYFASENRNKRGLSIDLKSKSGQEIVKKLIEKADILITNYGAGVPKRLGIDFETISKINPEISMVQITGFGLDGPYKDYAAYDGIVQSMSGLASLTGHPGGKPTIVGTYIADHIAGLQASMGAMLALFHRERTKKGKFVDVSMLDSIIPMFGSILSEHLETGKERELFGNRDPRAFCNAYPTKDGYIFIAPNTQKMWESFCGLMNRVEWTKADSIYSTREGRMENRDDLESLIAEWTKQYSKLEIFDLLQKEGIASGPVNSLADIAKDPQVKNRDMIRKMRLSKEGEEIQVNGVPIKISDTPFNELTPPPAIGEHSEGILSELGYTSQDIKSFSDSGVISSERVYQE
ncbi:CaiB/BaiF CoA transferase family protein [Oceanobacillus rekensis]|uniref:CaiB/BaiF CoA transferase family protein n=1 Tax=Oceanobacillus rekensis TaxID=937927 RepID=UPI000B43A2D9|nr:CoA transferase [Oceanobacillus rekensis]